MNIKMQHFLKHRYQRKTNLKPKGLFFQRKKNNNKLGLQVTVKAQKKAQN